MRTKLFGAEKNGKWIKTVAYPAFVLGCFILLLNNCKKDEINIPTVTDIDGNIYHTVNIGGQVWMIENLNVTRFRNGDPIPNITNDAEWSIQTEGAYCNYNNDESTGKKYGKLYNWLAVADSRNIAPEGWHVPSDAEWLILENYVAAHLDSSPNVAKALAAGTDWTIFSEEGSVGMDLIKNNSSGFTALPAGYRLGGVFNKLGDYGGWWSSTESTENNAWIRVLFFSYNNLATIYHDKANGFSVRCIQD